MAKFKPGDRVVCVMGSDDGSFIGHPGETFTVSSMHDGDDVRFVSMTEYDVSVDAKRFELANTEESDLAFLIKTANEGMRAEHLLLEKFYGKVERRHSNGDIWTAFAHNPYNGYSVYREKPKPTFAPFYVGPKEGYDCRDNPDHKLWKVELKDSLLCIGTDWVFDPIPLMNALEDMTKDSISGCTISGLSLDCMRNGIVIQGKYQISWEDAELVLKALEGVYLK